MRKAAQGLDRMQALVAREVTGERRTGVAAQDRATHPERHTQDVSQGDSV